MGTTSSDSSVVVFGRPFCGDTVLSREFLDSRHVHYTYRDIVDDEVAREEAHALSGRDNTPVILIGNRTVLVEPTDDELGAALDAAGHPTI